MNNTGKIGLLGGDRRQASLAARLSERGYECAVWGLDAVGEALGGAVRCLGWQDTLRGVSAVILPLPLSRDGVTLNAPLSGAEPLRLSYLLDALSPDTLLLGGHANPDFAGEVSRRGIPFVDYFTCEELQIKNALPTAEGAVALAMERLPVTLFGAETAVLGYGRIARVLSRMLSALHAHVTVCARKSTDLAWAGLDGCRTLALTKNTDWQTLAACDAIFNTVPARILDREALVAMGKKPWILDLSAEPGGVDLAAASELGLRAERALSLPGKVAPETAGAILCDCLCEMLAREEIFGGQNA